MFLPTPIAFALRAAPASARAATVLALALFCAPARGAGALGDRLVIGINSVPYTQRQVESYIVVKESLRKGDAGARVIDARTWPTALQVFGEDMLVLQEAERLGSYQNESALVAKFRDVVKQKEGQSKMLAGAIARLGLDDAALTRTLEAVLRVAAFRKGKEKDGGKEAGARPKWLVDLEGRAVLRYYRDADKYVLIEPAGVHGD